LIDDIVEIAGEAYDQDSTAAARVGVDTRFGVSGCFLPSKYDRRNIEAEAITIGRPDFARAVIEQSVIPCLRAPLLPCSPDPL